MGQHTSGANGDLEAPGPSELAVEAGTAASLPPNRGAAPGPEFGDGNLGGNLGHADPSYEDVVFHIEYLSDYRGKLNMRIFRFGMLICVVLLVLECVWQLSPSENQLSITLNEIYLNLVISSILIVIVLAVGGLFVYRVAAFRLAGKRMNLRRKRILTLVTIDLVSDLLILIFYLAPNAYALVKECGWLLGPIRVMGYFRWVAEGVFLSNQVLQALVLMPVERLLPTLRCLKLIQPTVDMSQIRMGIDLPARVYVILFFMLWSVQFVVLTVLLCITVGLFGPGSFCTDVNDPACFSSANSTLHGDAECAYLSTCSLSEIEQSMSIASACWVLLVLAIYFVMLFVSYRWLKYEPYHAYRTSWIELGVQMRTRLLMAVFMSLAYLLLWLLSVNRCASNRVSWLGMASSEVIMAMLVLMSTNFHMPEIPEPGQVKLHVWLQDTAWLEADVPNRLKARPFTGEPIFCFETALKLDYFCHLLYDIEEVPDAVCTLETALGLYDLTHHKLIWKRDVDAKCLAAWNPETGRIVLGFRGTASVANVLDDLKVWRSAYLPVTGSYWLGTMPMVHYGFIRHWIRSGLQAEVLETIGDIMKTPPTNGSGRWRVLITGHSLGGAVCKLAGYDIANAAKTLSPGAAIDLSYVTYGCPRVGNEAFAKKLHRLIPDGWDVMHPDDIVANGGKFIFMYKRESFPVILTTMGDLIVRPSYMERHVRGTTGQSIQEHLLTTYTMSLAEVMKGQFKNKELEGGKEALLKLWDCAFVRQMVEDAAVGLKSEAIAELGQIASEAHAAQSVKKKDDTHVARGETMRRRQSLRHAAVQLASFSNPERPKADGGDRLV